MILYKYVSLEAGMRILQNNSIGFTQPSYFNDPFEVEAAYPVRHNSNPVDGFFSTLRNELKKNTWKTNTGILSLTRQPLNSLMWAHYGLEHKGMVVGIDCAINEFTDEKTNLIPVQYGNVIYTNVKPNSEFLTKPTEAIEVAGTFHFPRGQLERLQRMFLYKASCWAYEEEVRVAKCLKGIETNSSIKSGDFCTIEVSGRPLHLFQLPIGAIKEVYIGTRASELTPTTALKLVRDIREYQPNVEIYGCKVSRTSWSLEAFNLELSANK
jgi:hypothetical protein